MLSVWAGLRERWRGGERLADGLRPLPPYFFSGEADIARSGKENPSAKLARKLH